MMTKLPHLPIAIGKITGLIIGLSGLILFPLWAPDTAWLLRIGIVLWYTTLGGLIGLIVTLPTQLDAAVKLPHWSIRAITLGAWMNFVLVLIAYNPLEKATLAIWMTFFGRSWASSLLDSPFWFVLEGSLMGLIIGSVVACSEMIKRRQHRHNSAQSA